MFGSEPGKIHGYPGHEEIELALCKLADATSDAKYLELARYFIDERGDSRISSSSKENSGTRR